MAINFTKMHGLGNDFVVIDAINQSIDLGPEQVRQLADRHLGIGCDQLLLVESAVGKQADFRYRIFNADGGEVGQCGNGARCFMQFVREQGLTDKTQLQVETASGPLQLIQQPGGQITVDMGVPRLEPAVGADLASHPPHPVSDLDFRRIVAILRLMVPYTGIIMSTRETAEIRRATFALGVSQISAGSRTNPGGYADGETGTGAQFSLGDHRPLDEVVRDVAQLGYVPSFCTGCYRLGRTGADTSRDQGQVLDAAPTIGYGMDELSTITSDTAMLILFANDKSGDILQEQQWDLALRA